MENTIAVATAAAHGYRYIGAGLATLGMIGAGIKIVDNRALGLGRNPSAAGAQFGNAIIGAALAEALGILAFVLGVLILFS